MKNKFITSALLFCLFTCLVTTTWGQSKKVVGHFHKDNGHTKRIVAKQKSTKDHYKIKYGVIKKRNVVPIATTGKALQKGYNDAIIKKLSKKPGKNNTGKVIAFANQFSREVANKFDVFIEIDNVQMSGGRNLVLKAEYQKDTISSYQVWLTSNRNEYKIASIDTGTLTFTNNQYLQNDSMVAVALLRMLQEYPIVIDTPKIILTDTPFLSFGNAKCSITESYADYLKDSTTGIKYIYDINKALLYAPSIANNTACNCGSFTKDSVLKYANESCYGCYDGNTLIYDAKCKKLWQIRNNKAVAINNMNDVHLYYGKVFKVKLIRFNRYLNTINVGNSDISFSSTMPALMQHYLFPGGDTSGSVNPYNSYASSASSNSGGRFFNVIPNLRSTVDQISDLAAQSSPDKSFIDAFNKFNEKYKSGQDLFDMIVMAINAVNAHIDSLNGEISNTGLKRFTRIKDIVTAYDEENVIHNIITDIHAVSDNINRIKDTVKANTKKIDSNINKSITALARGKYDSKLKNDRLKYLNTMKSFNINLDLNSISDSINIKTDMPNYIGDSKKKTILKNVNPIAKKYNNSLSEQNSLKKHMDSSIALKNSYSKDDTILLDQLQILEDSLLKLFKKAKYSYIPLSDEDTGKNISQNESIKNYIKNIPVFRKELLQLTKEDIDSLSTWRKNAKADAKKKPALKKDNGNIAKYTDYIKSDSISLNNLDELSRKANSSNYMKLDTLCNNFKNSLQRFSKFYDDLLDKKINAYSTCTNSISCCNDNGQYSYTYFDTMLQNMNNDYTNLRTFLKDTVHNVASKDLMKGGKDNGISYEIDSVVKNGKVVTKTIKKPTTVDTIIISSSDLTIQNNRITGMKLHQLADTAKAKAKAAKAIANDVLIAEMDTSWTSFEKINSIDIIRMILFNNNMTNENMSYTTVPIIPFGDRLGLTLTLGPTADTMNTMPTSVDNISFDFPVYNKTFFSFSTGAFYGFNTGQNKALISPAYSYEQVPSINNTIVTSSPYHLVKTNSGSFPVGLDAMANVSRRLGNSWLKGGLSFGIGAATDVNADNNVDIRLAYLGGLTLLFGNYQQFDLTLGGTFMQVNQLQSGVQGNPNIYYSSTNMPSSVQYNKVLQSGYFISLSYVIFSIKSTGAQSQSSTTPSN